MLRGGYGLGTNCLEEEGNGKTEKKGRSDEVRIWGRGVPVTGDTMFVNLATALIRQALRSWCSRIANHGDQIVRLEVVEQLDSVSE